MAQSGSARGIGSPVFGFSARCSVADGVKGHWRLVFNRWRK